MVDLAALKPAAAAAAKRGLEPTEIIDVSLKTTFGTRGKEVVRVLIVVSAAQLDQTDSDHFMSALLNVQQDLRAAGEERLVVLNYATPSDLADDGDPEP